MDMEIIMPTQAQGFLLAALKRQTQHSEYFEKKAFSPTLL
jgi:hypothetical protein